MRFNCTNTTASEVEHAWLCSRMLSTITNLKESRLMHEVILCSSFVWHKADNILFAQWKVPYEISIYEVPFIEPSGGYRVSRMQIQNVRTAIPFCVFAFQKRQTFSHRWRDTKNQSVK